MSDAAVCVGLAISAGSLVVAIIALVKSGRAQDRAGKAQSRATQAHEEAAQAQQQIAEIEAVREEDRHTEQNKAYLIARFENDPIDRTARRINQFYLVVENKGRAEARGVVVTMDGQQLGENLTIGPQSEHRHKLAITREERKQHEVALSWEDDSGEPGHYRTTPML